MTQKIGRNDLCPCGSGKKYKRCCITGPKRRFKATVLSTKREDKATPPVEELGPDLIARVHAVPTQQSEEVTPQ